MRELEAKGVRLRDQAVLCRTNTRLNEIASALEVRGIPVLHLGSLFERDEIRDLLSLLSLAIDAFGGAIVRLGALPRYNLSLQDAYLATQSLQASGRVPLSALPQLPQLKGLSAEGVAGLTRLASDCEGILAETTAWEFLSTYLLDRTDIVKEMSRRDSVADRIGAVAMWQFLNFVRDQSPGRSGLPIRRVLDRVRQLVLMAEERDLRQVPAAALHFDAVRLMTVHGSKGLEFEAVHVPGLTTASFPSSARGQRCPPPTGMIAGAERLSGSEEARRAHDDEEECLFFVAVSRARSQLILHLSRKQANGKNRNPSPFVSWIPSHLIDEIAEPCVVPLPADAPRSLPISVSRSTASHVTNGQLALYEKCPRRFFYTHVLGLGGAEKRRRLRGLTIAFTN